ncbi:PREDICTED: uncharacterized protein LOC104577555 [Tinamus guttatus]|uniref:uncharacterized protein LOC104577555 n=2 Tax=Tinamus guttatus TaxID=94827 RepID=UPI00052EF156|nr:PREDICTED: uncharacterized protein LOC104577555 [Tinamus guttatus]
MAARSPDENLRSEASCSICLEYFRDPVSIHCGHNFCRGCISRCWEWSTGDFPCPRCRETAPERSFRPNRELARVLEVAKRMSLEVSREDAAEPGGCSRHREPLRVFCKEDAALLCGVCRESRAHRAHAVIPAMEAAEEYKGQIQARVQVLKEERDQLLALREAEMGRNWEYLEKTEAERRQILSEFQRLRLFLEDQARHLLAHLGQLDRDIEKMQEENVTSLTKEISRLDTLIQDMEEKCQEPAREFLQDIRSTLSRCEKGNFQQPPLILPELEKKISHFRDKTLTLKETLRNFQDILMFELPEKTKVTLDPSTAHPQLVVSADGSSVRWEDAHGDPDNVGLSADPCVLGREGIVSGRLCWDVEVEPKGSWALGVAKQPTKSTDRSNASPEVELWSMGLCEGQFWALTSLERTALSRNQIPRRVRVSLDYEGGQVAFFDADTRSLIFAFPAASFHGESVHPWFLVWNEGSQITLCPIKHQHGSVVTYFGDISHPQGPNAPRIHLDFPKMSSRQEALAGQDAGLEVESLRVVGKLPRSQVAPGFLQVLGDAEEFSPLLLERLQTGLDFFLSEKMLLEKAQRGIPEKKRFPFGSLGKEALPAIPYLVFLGGLFHGHHGVEAKEEEEKEKEREKEEEEEDRALGRKQIPPFWSPNWLGEGDRHPGQPQGCLGLAAFEIWPASGAPSASGAGSRGCPELCEKHQEPLKLFCEVDEEAICVVCREARSHKHHSVVPLEEVVQDYKNKLQSHLEPLKKKLDAVLKQKSSEEEKITELRDKMKLEIKELESDFELLHQFLIGEQVLLLQALEERYEGLLARQGRNVATPEEQRGALERLLAEGPDKMPGLQLLQDIKGTFIRCENIKFQEPEMVPVDVGRKNRNYFLQDVVMRKMEKVFSKVPQADVTLDPDTAHPRLSLSLDRRSVKLGERRQELPENPKRFDSDYCVLGSQGFSGGRPGRPRRFGVYLDYERGQLGFYNAESMSHIHTFNASFHERIFPFFRVLAKGTRIKICA